MTTGTCQHCGKEMEMRAPNQRYHTTCANVVMNVGRVAARRVSRGFKEDNGNPGFRWLAGYIVLSGRWEAESLNHEYSTWVGTGKTGKHRSSGDRH